MKEDISPHKLYRRFSENLKATSNYSPIISKLLRKLVTHVKKHREISPNTFTYEGNNFTLKCTKELIEEEYAEDYLIILKTLSLNAAEGEDVPLLSAYSMEVASNSIDANDSKNITNIKDFIK